MTHNGSTANDELARRLEAYARVRLSPSPAAVARMRSGVMSAVAGAAASGPIAETMRPAEVREGRIIRFRQMRFAPPRTAIAALLAATLSLLLISGAAFASTPGGPLYGVRMWVESVALPSEPDARADAELNRLEARMDEVLLAAGAGNGSGVNAALAAYDQILTDALDAASRGQLDHTQRLALALNRHHQVLIDLLDQVPDQARDAIANAIERSGQATPGAGAGSHGPNGGNGGGNGGGKPDVRPTPRGGPQTGPQSGSGSGR
jgi:Domain of unknown function (DUF5667)